MNDFDEYQALTKQTAGGYAQSGDGVSTDEAIQFLTLALNGEAGEAAEKAKKYKREGDEKYLEGLETELGDILWYLARLADELDVAFCDVAGDNLEKLFDRQERDAIFGEGDER